jgi:hypothetical protein
MQSLDPSRACDTYEEKRDSMNGMRKFNLRDIEYRETYRRGCATVNDCFHWRRTNSMIMKRSEKERLLLERNPVIRTWMTGINGIGPCWMHELTARCHRCSLSSHRWSKFFRAMNEKLISKGWGGLVKGLLTCWPHSFTSFFMVGKTNCRGLRWMITGQSQFLNYLLRQVGGEINLTWWKQRDQ